MPVVAPLVLVGILLVSSTALGALIRLSLEELVQRSRLVIAGEVVGTTSYRGPFHDLGDVIFTDVRIRIHHALKGSPGVEEIAIQVLGGRIGQERMACLESPQYEIGERVLVFLRDYNGKVWNTGWLQGKYTLDGSGAITGKTIARGKQSHPIDRDLSLDALKGYIALADSEPVGSDAKRAGETR